MAFLLTIVLLSISACAPGLISATTTGAESCDETKAFPQMIKIPGTKQTWQLIHDCRRPNPIHVATALDVFYEYWIYSFGDPKSRVKNSLNNMLIEWKGAPVNGQGYSIKGDKVNLGRIKGVALTKGYMWIYIGLGQNICTSSFTHELIHIAIWALNDRHGDPDHEGDIYYGWLSRHTEFIELVNTELCRLNI